MFNAQITGPCLCDDHAVCGKTNREQLWVEWQDLQNDEMILHIQLSSTRCGSQWSTCSRNSHEPLFPGTSLTDCVCFQSGKSLGRE